MVSTCSNHIELPEFYLYNEQLAVANHQRHLGVILSSDLRWSCHIDHIMSKSARLVGLMKRLKSSLSTSALLSFYKLYIRPTIEYADVVWSGLTTTQSDRLERLQLRIARLICNLPLFEHTHHSQLLTSLDLPSLQSRRLFHLAVFCHKLKQKNAPGHLLQVFFETRTQPYLLRHSQHFDTPIPRTRLFLQSPLFKSTSVFDTLPSSVQDIKNTRIFKKESAQLLLSTSCKCSSYPYYH